MSNEKDKNELIQLLRQKVKDLTEQLKVQENSGKEMNELAVGFYQDSEKNFHKVVLKFNPETRESQVTEDELVGKSFGQATMKARDFLEMKVFLDTSRR